MEPKLEFAVTIIGNNAAAKWQVDILEAGRTTAKAEDANIFHYNPRLECQLEALLYILRVVCREDIYITFSTPELLLKNNIYINWVDITGKSLKTGVDYSDAKFKLHAINRILKNRDCSVHVRYKTTIA